MADTILTIIENSFKEIKEKRNILSNLNIIERNINRLFNLNFKVSIVENDTNEFFGMSIYPSSNLIDDIIIATFKRDVRTQLDGIIKMWSFEKNWFLEIDSILLYDKNLNANPSEITAVLLHEVGHVIHSNEAPQRFVRLIKYSLFNINFHIRELCKNDTIRKLFSLALIESCITKNFNMIQSNTEIIADKHVIKFGYADSLNNFIDKLIASQGNNLVERTDKEKDIDVKTIIRWTIDNISELEFRKSKLKIAIQSTMLGTPSIYIKTHLKKLVSIFFGEEGADSYKQILSEQYFVEMCNLSKTKVIKEFFDKFGKIKKIQQSDIDILFIEFDKMENNNDKIYLIELIHDKLDIINAALECIKNNEKDRIQQSETSLKGFKIQLEKLRLQTLGTHLKEKQYGIFIKYPKGYEG